MINLTNDNFLKSRVDSNQPQKLKIFTTFHIEDFE